MSRRILAAAALAFPACSQPAPPPAPVRPPAPTTPTRVAATTTTAPPVAVAPTTAATAPAGPSRVPAPVASAGPAAGAGGAADPVEGMEGAQAQAQTARASWYGNESGSRTANGEAFTGNDLTFAHLSMAFGTLVRFCHGGACVVARCNDRGPAKWTGKTFDLSRAAFAAIAPLGSGVITVEWKAA